MIKIFYEIFAVTIIYIASVLIIYLIRFLVKSDKGVAEKSYNYKNYILNYSYVIYGFVAIGLVSSIAVFVSVMLNIESIKNTQLISIGLFGLTIFISFFHVLKSRD